MRFELKAAGVYLLFVVIFVISISIVMPRIDSNFKDFFDALYWAIITISTVGYGDITPSNPTSRLITLVLIMLGVVALSLFTATIVAKLVQKTILKIKDWENMENVANHLIICGYSEQSARIIRNFLEKKIFESSKIALIHSVFSDEIESFVKNYKIKFIQGDFTDEETLKNAKIKRALKAIVLSNSSEDDAKVLSTVILLKSLNKNIYVIAEITNPKFSIYLEKIYCDEIVLTKEYDSNLVTKIAYSPGISKVFGEMLKDKNFYIQKYYGEKTSYEKIFKKLLNENKLLIGIIENYGRAEEFLKEFIEEIKKEAKRVSELTKYLKEAEDKELNKVVLYPPLNYEIDKFCGLIILNRSNNEKSSSL
jgi:voltage-gated potassium channel